MRMLAKNFMLKRRNLLIAMLIEMNERLIKGACKSSVGQTRPIAPNFSIYINERVFALKPKASTYLICSHCLTLPAVLLLGLLFPIGNKNLWKTTFVIAIIWWLWKRFRKWLVVKFILLSVENYYYLFLYYGSPHGKSHLFEASGVRIVVKKKMLQTFPYHFIIWWPQF